jgi:hypothetical protein
MTSPPCDVTTLQALAHPYDLTEWLEAFSEKAKFASGSGNNDVGDDGKRVERGAGDGLVDSSVRVDASTSTGWVAPRVVIVGGGITSSHVYVARF